MIEWEFLSHTDIPSVTNDLYFCHKTSLLRRLHNNTLTNKEGFAFFHMHTYCSCWHISPENEHSVSMPPCCTGLPSRPLIILSPSQKCQPSHWYIASHMLHCLAFKYQCWSAYLSRSLQELKMQDLKVRYSCSKLQWVMAYHAWRMWIDKFTKLWL